ncbi:MAG: extracellular solute-binding protein [Treponema sp.]|nr:extracellular solute-binding protein [Treponema sp.]
MRLFRIVLLVVLGALGLFACREKRPSLAELMEHTAVTAAPGELPLTEERAELTVLVNKPPWVSDLNRNESTAWYEEYTNVRVRYIHVPQHGQRETTNLHIAAGDYPDIIMNAGMSTIDEINYGSQGIFIPLNDLIEEHGYWYNKAIERIPILPAAITQPDGNIYGLPNINEAFHTFYSIKAWINQDWLDNLGLQMPETTEEFYQTLRAFQTQNPNGDRTRGDEIPFMGYFRPNVFQPVPYVFLLNSFVYFNPNNYLAMNNGNVVFVANTEEFREGLRYVARLVDEGLLHRASFTQNIDQARQLGTSPGAPRIGAFTDFVWWNFVGDRLDTPEHRADNYVAIPPLRGPQGVRYALETGNGFNPAWAQITDNARDPILAFRWLDAMYSLEATKVLQLGIMGRVRDDPDPGALGINRLPAIWKLLVIPNAPPESPYYAPQFLGNRTSELRLGEQADWDNPVTYHDREPKLYRETLEKYYPHRPPEGVALPHNLNYTTIEAAELGRMANQINTFVGESIVAFITGNKNLDRDWASYIGEFRRLELTQYLQLIQNAYNRQYR